MRQEVLAAAPSHKTQKKTAKMSWAPGALPPTYAPTTHATYAASHSYARPALTAFVAGHRRDPLSRVTHITTLHETGRLLAPPHAHGTRNLFGPGAVVPDRWPGSWETEIQQHARPMQEIGVRHFYRFN